MKTITFNDDNLSHIDIVDETIKARAILINDNNEILLSNYAGNLMLPGGKLESDESITQGLIREVMEETGINLETKETIPFLILNQFIKNYPKRNSDDVFSARLITTYYFIIKTNERVNADKIELMENEKNANFETMNIKLEDIPNLLEKSVGNNPRNKYFVRELVVVLRELFDKLKIDTESLNCMRKSQ